MKGVRNEKRILTEKINIQIFEAALPKTFALVQAHGFKKILE
jgi:hypothetical protein